MTEHISCLWFVCCSLLQLASSRLPDFQDKLFERSHIAGSPYEDLESVTVQKPVQLRSPSSTSFNRGIAHIPGGIQVSGMHRSAFRPGFNAGVTSGSPHQLQSPIQTSTQQRRNQVPNALFGNLRFRVAEAVQQGVQEVHSEDDLDSFLSQANEPVMVEFTTTWCKPCKSFAPIYDRIATDYSGKARFLKVTVNENQATSLLGKRFNVKAIPSFLLFHDKEIVAKETGVRVELNLRQALNTCVG